MNKLKGAMKIYAFQDFAMICSVIFIFVSFLVFGLDDIQNGVFNLEKSFLLLFIPMMAAMDYLSSFSIRFLMQANFNCSRKLFYKANLIVILLKTISMSLIFTIYVIAESFIYKHNNGKFTILMFGQKSDNIGIKNLILFFVIGFSIILFAYSFNFMMFSIERCQIIILFAIGIFGMIIVDSVLSFDVKNFNNYIFAIVILLSLTLLCFLLSWQVIKRKSILGNSWITKMQMSMSRFSK